ncbi:multiple epidermal growth factor-like domains protein 10 [Mya arenaria]|uniref:multiple epidermal growth factor-like domains protein 10 n=1 Tax=Mya arenaria TaxID=6604 RepID=UPI0022E7CB9E|nr:multiple epidermal growth factor-like domains protein 10 [Mya arenaria]
MRPLKGLTLKNKVMFRILALLCLARLYLAITVIIDGVNLNCSTNCACCNREDTRCNTHSSYGSYYCHGGCVETIWGNKCRNRCRGNCLKCEHHEGIQCLKCKDTFYDLNSNCNKSCSIGCADETCTDDGTCKTCKTEFEGDKCDTCIQGRYGEDCSMNCHHQNCRCTYLTGCDSCKTNFTGSICMECKDSNYGADCNMTCPSGCSGRKCTGNGICYQCVFGYYGEDCNTRCSSGCSGGSCMRNGTCIQCKHGYYGEQCKITCSTGCRDGECYRNGTCTCKDNFTGTFCNECVVGKYGDNCQHECGEGCSPSYCSKEDGYCSCSENFAGTKCNLCKNGLFGLSCDLHCSDKCVERTCSRIDGACTHGCDYGYSDTNCTTKCDSDCGSCQQNDKSYCTSCLHGYSGSTCTCPPNCDCKGGDKCIDCLDQWMNPGYECKCQKTYCTSNTCTTCLNSTFFLTNRDNSCCECPQNCQGGSCTTGPQCTRGCVNGFYGMDCSQKCDGDGCLKCSQVDGKCSMCKTGLYPNEHGNCTSCNSKCNNGKCNSETGKCIHGCAENFWGDKCDIPCNPNCGTCQQDSGICDSCTNTTFHGLYCNASCSSLCYENKCYQSNGHCSNGCNRDFFGNLCQTKCPANCKQSETDTRCNADGICKFNCVDGYVGVNCSEALKAGPLVAAIAGGVSSGVVVIIGVAVAFFFFRRSTIKRNGNNKLQANITEEENKESTHFNEGSVKKEITKQYSTGSRPSANKPPSIKQHTYTHVVTASEIEIDLNIDDANNGSVANSSKDDQTYYNELGSSTNKSKIPIGQLVKYVDGKSHEAFSVEFEKFPIGIVKPYVESQKKENISKNRYKGIYPYDDSRVKVRGSGGSDYINASFVDGYKKPKQYIATLGPTSQQLGNFSLFWKMIWQQRVEKIVMLTNLIEQGSPKCEQYWPNPGTTKKYGDIKVESCSEDEYAEFTRRAFTVTMGSKERTLHHLHFTCWPDKAIPDDVTAMIEFRQRVLSTPSTLNGPTVVHCSAGVGRTGTYIALDILTNEGETEKAIDIPGCVHKMRQNRPNMVQTRGQYQFLHTAVVYSLTFHCKQVKGENFNEYINKHTTRVLDKQFELLQHTVETRSKNETEAVERNKQHLSKNRANADIPGNKNRPRLYLNLKPGSSDYINAVYIHSFRMKKRYLVAQTPLPETVSDFLTLAVQERCSCIVSFEVDMDKQRNIGIYYPAANQEVLEKGTFQISCSREENKTFYAERTLTIQQKGTSTDRIIPHLQFTDWDETENIPRSTKNFMSFLNVIDNVMKQQEDGPILVHCFDGAGKSGLFCVVSLLLHKMAVEHEVSVLNTVRKVKTTRRLAIPNQEQFVFCHGCVSEYLRSFDVYANFSDDTGQL